MGARARVYASVYTSRTNVIVYESFSVRGDRGDWRCGAGNELKHDGPSAISYPSCSYFTDDDDDDKGRHDVHNKRGILYFTCAIWTDYAGAIDWRDNARARGVY